MALGFRVLLVASFNPKPCTLGLRRYFFARASDLGQQKDRNMDRPHKDMLTPNSKRVHYLGRTLGHFIFSLIGLKRILFTNIFQKL